jgi:hypothetical protein
MRLESAGIITDLDGLEMHRVDAVDRAFCLGGSHWAVSQHKTPPRRLGGLDNVRGNKPSTLPHALGRICLLL